MAAEASKLESINDILTMVGSLPTSSLGVTRPDVSVAVTILDLVDRDLQAEGWYFNKEFNVTFTPDALGDIVLSNDIFSIFESSGVDSLTTRQSVFPTDLSKRGNRLYNMEGGTHTFTDPITVNLVRKVPFEDLPQLFRAYVTARAGRKFYAATRGAESDLASENAARARGAFIAEDMRQAEYNMFRSQDTLGDRQ